MAVTNNSALAKRMALLRSHGVTRDSSEMTHPSEGGWYYEQINLGFNYRMTELQAALGLSQMKRLDSYVLKRHELAIVYDKLLSELPIQLPHRSSDRYSSLHLYIIQIANNNLHHRREVYDALREKGIAVNVHYIPIHRVHYYKLRGSAVGYDDLSFPHANSYYEKALSLPLYPTLSGPQQMAVIKALQETLT
jgi:dTDP-4-amino-4,6-dideoxygalactose transaminase